MDQTAVVLGSTGGQTHWLYLVREGQIFWQLKVELVIKCYHSFLATFKIAMSLSPEGLFKSNLGCLWTAEARTKDEVALQWSCSPNITRNVAPPFRVIRSEPPYRQWAAVTTYRWRQHHLSVSDWWQMSCLESQKQPFRKIIWNSFIQIPYWGWCPHTWGTFLLCCTAVGKMIGDKTKERKFIRVTHRDQNLVGKLVLWVHFLSSHNPKNWHQL